MSGKVFTEEELANLSDEELMGMATPPQMAPTPVEETDTGVKSTEVESASTIPDPQENEDAGASGSQEAQGGAEEDDEDADKAGDAGGAELAPANSATTAPAAQGQPEAKADAGAKPEAEAKAEEPKGPTNEELRSLYDRVMGTFKANGKEIKLQSPDEAVRLMQMGANYTKKLQALQPQLKLLKMLENNNLLDETKLSYLIDLDKKNPAAIQKLVKDSGIDPLEIDTAAKTAYTPGNHKVSDQEIAFQTTIDELMLDPVGKETIITVNKTWDAQSKSAAMKDPGILQAIHEQRQNGIYDKISTELERRRMLGLINTSQPFIHAYFAVGKEMDAQGLLAPQPAPAPQTSRVVDTRAVTPPSKTVTNNDKAKAASPVSTSPKKVAQDFNPLALSDEEFEKTAALAQRL